jgi:hypothetical protein
MFCASPGPIVPAGVIKWVAVLEIVTSRFRIDGLHRIAKPPGVGVRDGAVGMIVLVEEIDDHVAIVNQRASDRRYGAYPCFSRREGGVLLARQLPGPQQHELERDAAASQPADERRESRPARRA